MFNDKEVSKEYLEALSKRNEKRYGILKIQYLELLSKEESLTNYDTLGDYTTDKMCIAQEEAFKDLEEQKKVIRDKAMQLHMDRILMSTPDFYLISESNMV